ncbi:glucuronate isomerase [Lactiplantibacillus paraplantarum]|uniref:Uronate isomerase n=1 Tax=Lactiplantibacillus paraplantarum TaxID=60520 RepID=A0ABQ0NBS6_9LACO|nr:glucuronate isomerase [Lactiplantibacillus paraplantarum]ERL45853.1 glucuronate isomerase [Lactiplantibacillus paraplantarum]MCU4685140.1 glucuronate isomerase [Lactiplantibacillus paraplantarum]QJU50882.1 glucuronate isomerase [Lactiplantibacillus paraplantarum]UKB40377.1 glucuronate isomerase [Lactiplantibacillus paraplantarum]GBF02544.1 glucuronate isomerase [Lactiplantibacillus paraplantarum]
MSLLDQDFLLDNEMAKRLFHNYAKKMPIIDFHCHLNPEEIYENKNYPNITRIWLNEGTYGDHYKWRLMRANGVPEELITGDGDEYEKFLAWAETIEKSLGNPLYEWTHLELKRFFGIDEQLNRTTAPAIWKRANELLNTDALKPRNLIKNSNVKAVCTTDDPASTLEYHKLLKKTERQNGFRTLPAMRPDKLIQIEKSDYADYLKELGEVSGVIIETFADVLTALKQRFEYFNNMGGRLSDHSLLTYHFVEATDAELDAIVTKGKNNESLTDKECDQYITMLLEGLMRLNKKFDWTMQFHINSIRDLNQPMHEQLGPDTGYDAVGTQPDIAGEMQKLYSKMQLTHDIPKSIFYSLNDNDWMQLATMMGTFQEGGQQRLQLGAGWWFNDTAEGMEKQLRIFAQQSLLPNFVGMLTDSRSFLSYPRHEYFRRVLCNFYGKLAEQGRVPNDEAILGQVVQNISYNNAYKFFGFFEDKTPKELFE